MRTCEYGGCQAKYYARGLCQKHLTRFNKYGDPEGGNIHAPPEVRFWRFVTKTDSCWLFRQHGKQAYGRFQPGGRGHPTALAHRYSYEMHHGPIPDGMVVMHTCDNGLCVNPDHLRVGTPLENSADMMRKKRNAGRAPKGTDNAKAVLNPDLVRLIRASPMYHAEIGRVLGVSAQTIRAVRSGLTWTHVT
jgi:hypothetical protein